MRGAEYRLPEGGGSVLVPASRLAELRLTMAAAGLPKTGRVGFELFDKVNLGTTEFTEHVNYRRGLEGELERTIMSLAEVEQARVHLTFPKESVYLESQQPAKASVLVRLRPGAHLAQKKHRDDGRHKADANFGVAKLGLRHGQSEIAHGGEPRATCDGRAVYCGDGRQRKIVNAAKDAGHARGVLHVLIVSFPQQGLELVAHRPPPTFDDVR
jgi:hypothetical protein